MRGFSIIELTFFVGRGGLRGGEENWSWYPFFQKSWQSKKGERS